jgi:hypothetical protein
MNGSNHFTSATICKNNPTIMTEALLLFQALIAWVEYDIYADSPNRSESLARAKATLGQAYKTFALIENAIKDDDIMHLHQANRILEEAEEAFGALSLARQRAACASWDPPETVNDYLFWIEDEATIQKELVGDLVLASALQGVVNELCALGLTPSPPPWEKLVYEEVEALANSP